jgi:hypothetical protein
VVNETSVTRSEPQRVGDVKGNIVELFPIPTALKIDKATWNSMPAESRDEFVRMWREGEQGLAVWKDRRCGRPKSHRTRGAAAVSFYELHLLEHEIWRRGSDADLVAKADALRLALAPDVARMALDDALVDFHEMAVKHGTTLAAALERYTAVEGELRAHPYEALVRLGSAAGLNMEAWATVVMAGVHPAHGFLLEKAAKAVRSNPDRAWEGFHFGFMADEVQRVRPDCVVKMPNGFLAVDYGRLANTPEARSLPVYSYVYKDGSDGSIPDAVA